MYHSTCSCTVIYYSTFLEHTSTLKCKELGDPEFGFVTQNGSVPNSYAVYNCFRGFNLVGEQIRYCMDNGEWTDTQPICGKLI